MIVMDHLIAQDYPDVNGIWMCTLEASWLPAPVGLLSQSSTMDLLVAGGRVLVVSNLLRLLSVDLVGDPAAADGLAMLNTDKS